LNGNTIDVVPLDLTANDPNSKDKKHVWRQVIEKVSAEGGRLTGRINADDALSADNTAIALLPRREFQNVLLVSEKGNLFLEKVLEANALVQLHSAKTMPGEFSKGTISVFHKATPIAMPPGPILVIDPDNDCDMWKVGDKLQNPIVTQQDKDSPLMANVRLDNVLMPEARKLTFAEGLKPQVLAAAVTGEPLYVAVERDNGPVLVLTVNLDLGDLPLRTAFPILASNALAHFAGGKGELREALSTGAVTEVALPAGADCGLRSPDGSRRPLPTGVAKTAIGPLDRVGIWSVVDSQPQPASVHEVACNLANASESDLRAPAAVASATRAESSYSAGLLGRPIWFYLIFLAWALAAVEWILYQRRWIS
jgi:hypothetical protein